VSNSVLDECLLEPGRGILQDGDAHYAVKVRSERWLAITRRGDPRLRKVDRRVPRAQDRP
jgi:hypothetical protein